MTLFWATYEQQGNTIALWADDHTDRSINLLIWYGEIPTTWFQAFNPFMIFAFTPFVIGLWAWQARRGSEPSTVTKMAIGCLLCALSYVIMAGAAWEAAGDEASWLWLFAYFVVITTGELYLSPIGLSLVSKIAPVRMVSMLMGAVARHELHRQFPRRLSRRLLEQHGKGQLLPDDRRRRRHRRRHHLGPALAAAPGAAGLAFGRMSGPALCAPVG